MECFKFMECTQNKIGLAMEGQKPEKNVEEESYFKSLYSPATLINDWYERRITEKEETKSELLISEQMNAYRPVCKVVIPDRKDVFNMIFECYGVGQELLIDHHGFSYYENYATTYDLMYNHLKKGICGPYPRRYYKGKYKPETDLTKIYGNVTEWGLKKTALSKRKEFEEPTNCVPMSETIEEFVAYDPSEIKKLNDFPRFKKPKKAF